MTYADGPTLEEASLWDDIAEIADERDQARRELAKAHAEIAELRALLATHRPTARRASLEAAA